MASETDNHSAHAGADSAPAVQAAGASGAADNAAAGSDAPATRYDSASSVDHVQDKAAAVKVTKWQKTKAHFRRFWWVYLIILIIILAIMLPVLFEVIIPKIVQDVVSGQNLPVYGGTLRALSPTQMNVSLNTMLDTPLAVTIDPMALELYNRNTTEFSPFFQLEFPKMHVDGKTNATITNQTVTISNHTELVTWFNAVFDEPEVTVSVRADPDVHLSSLDYHPHLDKQVSIKALNYLDGFGIQTLDFLFPSNDQGYNVEGKLDLPNSGSLELYLGNLTFNMMAGDIKLGLITVYEVDMKHGMNHPDFDGIFYFDELIPNLNDILSSQQQALSEGNLKFFATGNATVINGERIKYIEEVLNTKSIPFTIPVISLLADLINGITNSDGSLGSLVGDVFGNSTLIDGVLGHWNETDSATGSSSRRKSKRSALSKWSPRGSIVKSLLRLGTRTRSR